MDEYWDLYDENRNSLGKKIRRGDTFSEGEFYVCCEIWIQNDAGKLLITQRHPNKKAGGLWEFTGGGVLAGETTKQASVRELKEELGITIEESELKLIEVYQHKNYFMDIFHIQRDIELANLVLQSDEVVDAKLVSDQELLRMIEEKQVVRSVGMRYQQYKEKLI